MNIKEIFNSDNKTLADWCFNEFHQPIEADIESSDGLRCISYQMVIYALSDFLIMILSWLVKQSLRAFLFQEVQP